jgi:hypothetical protein
MKAIGRLESPGRPSFPFLLCKLGSCEARKTVQPDPNGHGLPSPGYYPNILSCLPLLFTDVRPVGRFVLT